MRRHASLLNSRVAVAVCLAVAALCVSFIALRSSSTAESPPPTVTVRGELVDISTFSLSTLFLPQDVHRVANLRDQIFHDCMAERGFASDYEPASDEGTDGSTTTYEAAAFGSTAWEDGPPVIQLPDGTVASSGLVWQPGSCSYEQDARLDTDPHLREALRYAVMEMRNEADQATMSDSAFGELADAWSVCSGDDPDSLLVAVDALFGVAGQRPPGAQPDETATGCAEDILAEVAQVRGLHHAESAAAQPEILDAWVALMDKQIDLSS